MGNGEVTKWYFFSLGKMDDQPGKTKLWIDPGTPTIWGIFINASSTRHQLRNTLRICVRLLCISVYLYQSCREYVVEELLSKVCTFLYSKQFTSHLHKHKHTHHPVTFSIPSFSPVSCRLIPCSLSPPLRWGIGWTARGRRDRALSSLSSSIHQITTRLGRAYSGDSWYVTMMPPPLPPLPPLPPPPGKTACTF